MGFAIIEVISPIFTEFDATSFCLSSGKENTRISLCFLCYLQKKKTTERLYHLYLALYKFLK
jgi:hypothetical protein